MKTRRELTASEVDALHERLASQLSESALRTQPEVACKVVELVNEGDAGVGDFARILRSDPGLSGRLLRMANSAYFSPRDPVTTVDRACVLLGLERIRAISMGFYLSRDADADSALSRRVWGYSVFRACAAGALAQHAPGISEAEAFLVGLMLDAGIPLMPRLVGPRYEDIVERTRTPEELFDLESRHLPFTHVDVAAALARRWRLPDVLGCPIGWHHTEPAPSNRHEPVHALHRVAYFVGSLPLSGGIEAPETSERAALDLAHHVDLRKQSLRSTLARATEEYRATLGIFADVADDVADLSRVQETALEHLLSKIETMMVESDDALLPIKLRLTEGTVEVDRDQGNSFRAFLHDSKGTRICCCDFLAGVTSASQVLDSLGIEKASTESLATLNDLFRRLAA